MKRYFYTVLTIAASLSALTSCYLDELNAGKSAHGKENTVDATFTAAIGPQTKAFSDGTTVNKFYAAVYEVGSSNEYTWIADNSAEPGAIASGSASVSFNDKLVLGNSYKVVFWAQKEGAPYSIDWAKTATTGPTITVTSTGDANEESRDAFYGVYETGTVTGNIDLTGSPVSLKRPFAQVNVLVPNDNFFNTTYTIYSCMTIAQAPTVLNLLTKETSVPADWSFEMTPIAEAAFGTYASTHQYAAMNYVLVDQTAADACYDITFSVLCGSQSANDKTLANIPLKPNGRTNIVGNIFDEDFDIIIPIVISPEFGTEQVLTIVLVAVGQTAATAVELNFLETTSIQIAVNHPIECDADLPDISSVPEGVVSASWNLTTGELDLTPLVANGSAVITLVFPSVTKTVYSTATVQIYVKVGNGNNA